MSRPKRLILKNWAEEDRPREKMMLNGPKALTNAELLAILIHTGSQEDSAVALTRKILSAHGNSLSELGKLSVDELCSFKGIGEAKAVSILAACELGRRRKEEKPLHRLKVRSSQDVYDYFYPLLADLSTEQCHVLYVNQAANVLESVCIGKGGLTETSVDIRCILREAMVKRATALALCHNHPSGNLHPSMQDDKLTAKLREACRMVNLLLMDHVIFTDNGYYSYADQGRLNTV